MPSAKPKCPRIDREGVTGAVDKNLARMFHVWVFHVHVSVCPRCGGPVKILDFITEPDDVALGSALAGWIGATWVVSLI